VKIQLHNILLKLGAFTHISHSEYKFVRANGKRKYRFPDHSCNVIIVRNNREKVPGWFDATVERFYMFRTYVKVHKGGNRFGTKGTQTLVPFMLPTKVCNMRGWKLV